MINQLVSSSCCVVIFLNLFVYTFEIGTSLLGSANLTVCRVELFLKNTLIIHYTLLLMAVSVTKYLYIFVIKSPGGLNDSFWHFYINAAVALFASTSQFVYQQLPGRNAYHFYTCSGTLPDKTQPIKFNYFLTFSFLSTLAVYIVVLVKIKLYDLKDPIPTISLEVALSSELTASNKFYAVLNNSLASFTTLATSLTIALPFIGLLNVLNATDPMKLGTFPYNHLIDFYQQVLPAILHGTILILYFKNQPHMRKTVSNKLRSILCN